MKLRMIAEAAVWAAGAFALALAAGLPATLNAVDQPAAVTKPKIETAVLTVDGVKLSIESQPIAKADDKDKSLPAGDVLPLTLVVTNTSSTTKTVPYQVSVMESGVRAAMSRSMGPSGISTLVATASVTIAPGETKRIVLDSKYTIKPQTMAQVLLNSGDNGINAYTLVAATTTDVQTFTIIQSPTTQPTTQPTATSAVGSLLQEALLDSTGLGASSRE